jgi:hypothetical protein
MVEIVKLRVAMMMVMIMMGVMVQATGGPCGARGKRGRTATAEAAETLEEPAMPGGTAMPEYTSAVVSCGRGKGEDATRRAAGSSARTPAGNTVTAGAEERRRTDRIVRCVCAVREAR